MKYYGIVACLALAACNTTGGGTVPVSNVQKEAVAICGYLPVAQVVSALIAKQSANLNSVFAIATAICNAVTVKGGAGGPEARGPGAAPPTVDGVKIHGRFVK